MIGAKDIDENFEVLTLNMKKRSQFGSSFLTLYTDVQNDLQPLHEFSTSSFRLDLTRPDSAGDSKCKVFKGRSAAKFYTGFIPIHKGYNGENGLIQRMTVYQCDTANRDLAEQFIGDTVDCYDDDYLPYSFFKSILFIWTPGSKGEMLKGETGLKALLNEKSSQRRRRWGYYHQRRHSSQTQLMRQIMSGGFTTATKAGY